MTSRILFVCLGNICRSPAAEAVFRSLMPGIPTDSAGTAGYHVEEPPYQPMQTAARARGIDLSRLRARKFTAEDFIRFDLILAMDTDNMSAIERLRPDRSRTPVRLFTHYAPDLGIREVRDPYYTRDFEMALDIIETAARGLAGSLDPPTG